MQRAEMRRELRRVDEEYAGRSEFAKSAAVYNLDRSPPARVDWQELPGVQLLKGFLTSPSSYTGRL